MSSNDNDHPLGDDFDILPGPDGSFDYRKRTGSSKEPAGSDVGEWTAFVDADPNIESIDGEILALQSRAGQIDPKAFHEESFRLWHERNVRLVELAALFENRSKPLN